MKRTLSILLSVAMILSFVPVSTSLAAAVCPNCGSYEIATSDKVEAHCEDEGMTAGTYCVDCNETISGREVIPALGHLMETVPAKPATYTGVGWEEYEACTRTVVEGDYAVFVCGETTYVEIPKLETPVLDNYDMFLIYLALLEQLTFEYVNQNPGKDPLALIIKYIRTGVERYNSGSWGIMAGYEDTGFAKFVAQTEDGLNVEIGDPEAMLAISSLKDLGNFDLPNGDEVDFGHMFGTLDITYHNNFSVNHADVAGWAGDLVDLLEYADKSGVDGTLEEMVKEISENYLGAEPADESMPSFSDMDIIGDLDGFYLARMLQNNGYDLLTTGSLGDLMDFETGEITPGILRGYFTEELSIADRAAFFLKNRLDGASTRSDVRDAVYNAYIGNKVVTTLEGTRAFTSENLENLKKACCYAFADYLCKLAGDYVEDPTISYFNVFSAEKSTLAPGVKQEIKYATTADGKQTVFYLATADITRDDVHVFANYKDNDPTSWGMQRVEDQANAAQAKYGDPASAQYIPNYSVIASVNGAGFTMATGEPGGLLVMGGVEYHEINSSGFFGILKDGTAVIGTTEEYNNKYKGQVQEGIAGFGAVLVKDGKIAVSHSDTYYNDRASRTAVGITKTGKVVFMVMDGRQEPHSCGGSMQEIAQVMLEAGCVHAVNLDGGGSTTYVAKPEGEEALKVVSKPSDGTARSVSTSLMIVSTAPDSKAFDHAVVDSAVDYMTVGASIQMTASGVSATGNSAEIPEGAEWSLSDNDANATITADGALSAQSAGTVNVNLVLGDEVLGTKMIEVVYPDNLYFAKTNLAAVYGQQITLPIKVLYNNKEVAITPADVTFELSNAKAGSITGFVFTGAEGTGIKTVQITATVTTSWGEVKTAAITVSLYNQGENTFDFEQATGGDRMLAWLRQVSNATTDDEVIYTVVDGSKKMETSYMLALDMTHIPIPERLSELTYMLPGADKPDASAWTFLCDLANRISVLSTVTPVVTFDPDVDVDYSNLNIITDYFELDGTSFDEETNSLTLTLRWVDQTQPIDPDTANPLCIVSGVKLTVKDDADWGSKNRLEIVNGGEISYHIAMQASALYTFAQNEENQKNFGLYDYVNPNDPKDAGGYFESTYIDFEDSYTLVNAEKSGWINEDGGFAYYVDGARLIGMQAVDGVYYDFGTLGINQGKTPYTGIFEIDGTNYYTRQGVLLTNTWHSVDGEDYHCHADGSIHPATVKRATCTKGRVSQHYCTVCKKTENVGNFIFPEGHPWDENYVCPVCGTVGKNIAEATFGFGTISSPKGAEYFYDAVNKKVRPSAYATFDGKTALTVSNDNNVNSDGTMKDLYWSWTNDDGIGKASINFVGRGDYYGEKTLEYTIVPNDVTLTATPSHNSITLTWNAAAGADYYKLYWYNKTTQNRTTINAKVTGTSYTITHDINGKKLTADTEYCFIMRSAAMSTDGLNKEYSRLSKPLITGTTAMPESTGFVKQASVVAGDSTVAMQIVDGQRYFFLPADADLANLKLCLSLDAEVSGAAITVSGDKKTASGTATGTSCEMALDLSQLASAEADGGYTIGIVVDQYKTMTVKVLRSANIPSMFITSDNPDQGRAYVDASKSNETTAQMTLTEANGTVLYDGALTQVKARGNSTFAHFEKKSYQIKLSAKTDLIGQGETVKTWTLLANYGDATLMHDKFFKDLAAQMDMPYVAGSDWVNLWYDGEYRGVYLLSEKNSVGSTGVDIDDLEEAYEELNAGYGDSMQVGQGVNQYGNAYAYTKGLTDPANITGGYLIELNHQTWDEVNGFVTTKGKGFNVKSPEWTSDAAMQYISEYYQAFENAVYATNANGKYTGYNTETKKYFYEYVDMDSLVKVFLIQELGLNPDGFISSLYFYKDVDGKMYAGPIWDQDMTLGTGWTKYLDSSIVDYHYLAEALIQIPVFKSRVIEYFNDEFAPMIRAALAAGGTVDSYYAQLADNAELNYLLWPYIRVGDPSNANHIWTNTSYDAVVADMESWMTARLAKLETIFVSDFVSGDANQDGQVSVHDAVAILQKLAEYEVPNFHEEAADFNGDGEVSVHDAVAILGKLAES